MSTATKLISASNKSTGGGGNAAEYFYYVASKLVSGSYGYRAVSYTHLTLPTKRIV